MSHKDGVDGDGDGEVSGGAAAAVVVMLVGEEERAPAQERGSCSGGVYSTNSIGPYDLVGGLVARLVLC